MIRMFFRRPWILVLIIFCGTFLPSSLLAQDYFILKGIILHNKKKQVGAEVRVFEDKELLFKETTGTKGKYLLRLPLQRNYLIEFSQKGLATKTIKLSTEFPSDFDKRKLRENIFVTLTRKKEKSGAVAYYRFNPKGGGVLDYELEYSEQTEAALNRVDKTRKERKIYQQKVKTVLDKLDPTTKSIAYHRLDSIRRVMDSLIGYANIEAIQIVQSAKDKSNHILTDVKRRSRDRKQIDKFLDGELPSASEIEKLYSNKKSFLVREDIKARGRQNKKLKALLQRSKKDSLRLLENAIFIKRELVKSARIELENGRLNARTFQDSLELVQKEEAILKAEQEIQIAKTRLDLQKAEIERKNYILVSVGVGIVLLLFLLLLYINKTRERDRMNKELSARSDQIARQNQNIVSSINYAKNIQNTILPTDLPSDMVQDYFIFFKPKDIVSGDFFWFSESEHNAKKRLYVAAVDCTGHGVPGAFMSLIGNRLLSEIVQVEEILEPGEILTQLNNQLVAALNQEQTENRDGMDVSLCMIENVGDNEKKVVYAGAKRPLIYIDGQQNELKVVKGDRKSIGGIWDRRKLNEKFSQVEVVLPKNSLIYLTSDGYIDQSAENRKRFGSKRLYDLLSTSISLSMLEQRKLLEVELSEYQATSEQRDDITIVGLRL